MLTEFLKRISAKIKNIKNKPLTDVEWGGLLLTPGKFEADNRHLFCFNFQRGEALFTLFKDANCQLSEGVFQRDKFVGMATKSFDEKTAKLMVERFNSSQSVEHIQAAKDENGAYWVALHKDCICSRWSKEQWLRLIETAENFLEQNPAWQISEGTWMGGATDYETVSELLKEIKKWLNTLESDHVYLSEVGKMIPLSQMRYVIDPLVDRSLFRKIFREIITDK